MKRYRGLDGQLYMEKRGEEATQERDHVSMRYMACSKDGSKMR
jgi:hypothetical protein